MFWKSKNVDVSRTMGRIINRSFSVRGSQPEHAEVRAETRSERTLPVMLVPMTEDPTPKIIFAFTKDVSAAGLAVLVNERINIGGLIVVLGEPGDRSVFEGTCCHCDHKGYGCFQAGVRLDKLLKNHDYQPLIDYADAIGKLHSSMESVEG